MARQTRQNSSRPPLKSTPRPAKRPKLTKGPASRKPSSVQAASRAPQPAPARSRSLDGARPDGGDTRPPAPPRKPQYYEALAMYEGGVRALQRHDYEGAASQFRAIIQRYPEERELQERSQLYLRVCERETARRPASPQTPQERVYAATVALNAGDTPAALDHLRRALADAPDSDHAHYIMAVALAGTGELSQALEHLRRAITLNSDNRSLAMQDPDLESVRSLDEFARVTDGGDRLKPRKRR